MALPAGVPERGRKVRINTGCGWMRSPGRSGRAYRENSQ